jgi:hypothetical protein
MDGAAGLGRCVFTLALIAALSFPAAASAAPPPPSALHVIDGEGWQADDHFTVGWTNAAADPPIAAVHYRVRDGEGAIESGPVRLGWAADHVGVSVRGPGAHTFEIWFEDANGAIGPPADIKLRYDSQRPGSVAAISPVGWIGRTELPLVIRLTHPATPFPLSGIRGYAVSIDREPASSPCAAAYLCTETETDLRGGIDDDTLSLGELPEGMFFVHALAVSGSQVGSLSPGHTLLRVDRTDPVTRLSGAPARWTNHTAVLEATATDKLSGMAPAAGGAAFTAIRIDDGPPIVAAGDSVRATVVSAGVHTIAYYARDAAGNIDDGADSNGEANTPPAILPLRIDREPPSVVFSGSASPEQPELIEARVSDALSGPDPARGEIAVRAAGSGGTYETLPTAVAGETLLGRWRSDDYPVGEYEFRVTGFDAAGNSRTSTRRANGEQLILPNPLKARTMLAADFEGGRRSSGALVVRRGNGATFGGRLLATSDAPLGGCSIEVVERFDAGAPDPRHTTVVRTDEEGRFSVTLAPGPSREVFAVFGGTSRATGTASRPLRLGVRGGVRLRASATVARVGGRPVVFRGAVAASPGELPPGGARVQLQFRAAGLPWSEFRTVQTNARGRFRYPYRFSDDDSRGIRFQFRAFVPTQSGWPYEPGSSRPVAVRGL